MYTYDEAYIIIDNFYSSVFLIGLAVFGSLFCVLLKYFGDYFITKEKNPILFYLLYYFLLIVFLVITIPEILDAGRALPSYYRDLSLLCKSCGLSVSESIGKALLSLLGLQ
ncbi:hypothetical protein [Clostridium transplantifaecale]|uniref:hypothetical protein n=1 Tax=Clostridium transplantifaecale TaxID=2479838 RepID=UPI000F63884D|nr:hypothetical protein [Clostridium transplantifaecale]